MHFANPKYLYLLLLLLPMIGWYIWKLRKAQASMQLSSTAAFAGVPKSIRVYLRHLLFLLRLAVVTLIIIVLARPQASDSWSESSTEGIDIILTVDISTSMLAEDLKPNRIEAAKNVGASFINSRQNDNIGLVLFAGESFMQVPLTSDHGVLLSMLHNVSCGMIEDGTAIGMGLANAVSRIKDSKAKSKVIILLTDGSNNRGEIAPVTAAEIARTFGVRVYTVGVGSKGTAPYPFQTAMGIRYQNVPVDIDEGTLTQIAELTGGKYFRATDNSKLETIYKEIDQLEKTKLNVMQFSKREEVYMIYALWAFVLLLLEVILRQTLLKNIP